MADEHNHGAAGGQMNTQQILQAFQQKIGNLELTVNALIGALVDEDVVDQDEINEKAQEIIEQIQEQQQAMQQAQEAAESEDED